MRAIALSLCIAGMFSGCRSGSTKGVALEHSIEQLIPGDTVMLAGARVEAMLTTPLYKRLSSNVQLVPELDSFSKRTGLDPRKDLKEFVIASNGKDTIGIAQVQLESPEKLEALLEKEGLRRTAFGKYTLMAGDSSTVAFLGKTIAIAGPNEAVKRALSPPGDESRKNEVLKRVALLPAGKHFWVAAIGGSAPMPLPETGNLANLARVFQSMESVTLTLDLQDGASLAVAGECRKPEDAKQIHDMIKALIGFGRLGTRSDQPEMLQFFDGVKVENTGRSVKLNADVSMSVLDGFLKMIEKRKPGA